MIPNDQNSGVVTRKEPTKMVPDTTSIAHAAGCNDHVPAAPPLRKYGLLRGTRTEPQIARVWTWWSAFVLPTLARTG